MPSSSLSLVTFQNDAELVMKLIQKQRQHTKTAMGTP